MARLFLLVDHGTGAAAPLVQLLHVALVVAAVVVSLCTSSTHAKLWKQRATTAPAPQESIGSRKHMLAANLSGIGGCHGQDGVVEQAVYGAGRQQR